MTAAYLCPEPHCSSSILSFLVEPPEFFIRRSLCSVFLSVPRLCWFGHVWIAASALGTIASRWRRSAMRIGKVAYAMLCAMSRAKSGRLIRGRRYVLIVRTRLGHATIAGGYIYARLLPIRVAGSMQMSGYRLTLWGLFWILLPEYIIGWVGIRGLIAALSLRHLKLIISIVFWCITSLPIIVSIFLHHLAIPICIFLFVAISKSSSLPVAVIRYFRNLYTGCVMRVHTPMCKGICSGVFVVCVSLCFFFVFLFFLG